jgi:hypothetical protein
MDSPDEDSGEEMPAAGKGSGGKTRLGKQTTVAPKVKHALTSRPSEAQPAVSSKAQEPSNTADGTRRAEPRRVGHASHPGGALRSKRGDSSERTTEPPLQGKKSSREVP